jgi:hypothetical protein
MLRRGAPFGPPLSADATADDGEERGLHFISVISDLGRQFEFVQRRWLNDPNFPNGAVPMDQQQAYGPPPAAGEPGDGPTPLAVEFDPGSQDALHEASGVHQFLVNREIVTVSAGEYFFVPSLTALADGAKTSTPASTSVTPSTATTDGPSTPTATG